ncbi:MAG: TlpA disulfide reductase family protein, partial [Gemmatimonadota bacterium]
LGYQALQNVANADSGAADGAAKAAPGASCAFPKTQAADQDGEGSGHSLTDAQVEKVVTFVVDRLVDADVPGAISREMIEKETGIALPMSAAGPIQAEVIARLQKDHPEILAGLESAPSRCAEYDACSLHGDLSGAGGETLVMYRREKAEDGQVFEDRTLPSFEAYDFEGNRISSDSLSGKPSLLVFLAGHCTHSMDTFPVLNDLAREYGPRGLNIVGVVVNSGTPQDVGVWASHFEPEYDIWVYTDPSIGDVIGSHLVPTYLYVDAGGNVREKLVGYKDGQIVDSWVARLLDSGPSVTGR